MPTRKRSLVPYGGIEMTVRLWGPGQLVGVMAMDHRQQPSLGCMCSRHGQNPTRLSRVALLLRRHADGDDDDNGATGTTSTPMASGSLLQQIQ